MPFPYFKKESIVFNNNKLVLLYLFKKIIVLYSIFEKGILNKKKIKR